MSLLDRIISDLRAMSDRKRRVGQYGEANGLLDAVEHIQRVRRADDFQTTGNAHLPIVKLTEEDVA